MERSVLKEEEEEEDIFYSPDKMEDNDENFIVINSNGDDDDDDDDEKKKVGHFRDMVEKQDSACKEIDDLTLRRFLRARDLDLEKASAMLVKYIAWRQKFVPKGSISASEVPNQIAHKKMFMQGTDKKGGPVGVVLGAKHIPCKKDTVDEFKRFVVFALDKLCSRMPDSVEKFTIIADLKGYGYSNSDVHGYIAALSILQDYYPERLRKLFIVHAPYIFMTAWKLIYPFIDQKTKKKITFVENKKLRDTLLEEIDENQLPEIYGGKLQLVPIQD